MSAESSEAQAGASPQRSPNRLRVAMIDRDPGFMQVLANRLDALRWDHRALSSAGDRRSARRNAPERPRVDVAVLGPGSWEYLERVCARLPGLAVIVCTGPSSVAQRVRGLRLGADAWVTKPCHAEELICVIEAAVRRHRRNEMPELEAALSVGRDHDPPRPLPGLPRRGEPRAHGARVRDPPPARAVRPRPAPRGDLRACLGLRDGARRPLGRRVRPQAASEAARGVSPEWSYIHTHFGVGYRFAPEADDGRVRGRRTADAELSADLLDEEAGSTPHSPADARRRAPAQTLDHKLFTSSLRAR